MQWLFLASQVSMWYNYLIYFLMAVYFTNHSVNTISNSSDWSLINIKLIIVLHTWMKNTWNSLRKIIKLRTTLVFDLVRYLLIIENNYTIIDWNFIMLAIIDHLQINFQLNSFKIKNSDKKLTKFSLQQKKTFIQKRE